MAKTYQRKLSPAAGRTGIERLEMDRFSRRLYRAMVDQGLSQSDLARKIWGTTEDKRGYKVARNRDRISSYLSGRSLPDPENLSRLAKALGLEESELAPDITAAAIDRENPEIGMSVISGHPDKVHLQVNKLLPLALASKIVGLISEYEEQLAKKIADAN